MPEAAWPEYADTVWREFTRRSGKAERLMSCLEFDVIHGWLEDGVPLRVVLRGMQDTAKAGKTLTYYEPSVRDEYARWRQAMTA